MSAIVMPIMGPASVDEDEATKAEKNQYPAMSYLKKRTHTQTTADRFCFDGRRTGPSFGECD